MCFIHGCWINTKCTIFFVIMRKWQEYLNSNAPLVDAHMIVYGNQRERYNIGIEG